ncbi:MAG: hypothetical protein P1U63_01235 [Coxiellaceae bacterium]|nr:hypothetical protein [Coxiellaceae bacterium]
MRHFILPSLLMVSQPLLASNFTNHFLHADQNKSSYAVTASTVTTPLTITRTEAWDLNDAPHLYAKVTGVTFYYQTDQITGRCSGIERTYDLNDEHYADTGLALNGPRGNLPPLKIFAAGFSYAANQLHHLLPTNGKGCAKLFISFKAGPESDNNKINTQFKPRSFAYTNIVSPGHNFITSGTGINSQFNLEQSAALTIKNTTVATDTVDTGRISGTNNTIKLANIGFGNAALTLPFNLRERGITTNCTSPLGINQSCDLTYDGTTSRGDGIIKAASSGSISRVRYPFHIDKSGQAKCWGDNDSGQLGIGSTDKRDKATPIPSMTDVKQIATGKAHACALKNSGDIYCWGDNTFGQLGNNTTNNQTHPIKINSISGAVSIAAGRYHSCALLKSGEVKCWGDNSYGQLGNNSRTQELTPVSVHGLSSGVSHIVAGKNYNCALLQTGTVKCWGENSHGQLGDGSRFDRLTPAAVSDLTNDIQYAVTIAAGDAHSCALLNDGVMKCWGENDYGQLGIGTNSIWKTTPQPVNAGVDIAAISLGGKHSCAVTDTGGAMCWGLNTDGQLGIGSFEDFKNTPQRVTGLTYGVVGITTSAKTTCALKSGGKVLCWGNNDLCQLGDGTTTTRNTPITVNNMENDAVDLASNSGEGEFNCAIE